MGKLLPFLMIAHKSSFWVYLTNVALYAVDVFLLLSHRYRWNEARSNICSVAPKLYQGATYLVATCARSM